MEMIIISSSKISYFSEFGGTGSYVTNRRNFLNYFCYLSPIRHCQPMLNVPKIYIFICNNSLFAQKHTASIYTSPLFCSVCSPKQLLLAFFMLYLLNNYLLSLVRRQSRLVDYMHRLYLRVFCFIEKHKTYNSEHATWN